MSAWQMSSLLAALEPTDAESCLEIATALMQINNSEGANGQMAIAYETGATYFEISTTFGSYRILCRFGKSHYEVIIVPLGCSMEPSRDFFTSVTDAARFIRTVALG